jgi:hypothetical protein
VISVCHYFLLREDQVFIDISFFFVNISYLLILTGVVDLEFTYVNYFVSSLCWNCYLLLLFFS